MYRGGCLAHARREFEELLKNGHASPVAEEAIRRMAWIFRIEKQTSDAPPAERLAKPTYPTCDIGELLPHRLDATLAWMTACGRTATFRISLDEFQLSTRADHRQPLLPRSALSRDDSVRNHQSRAWKSRQGEEWLA
jgi:hypothetical protein